MQMQCRRMQSVKKTRYMSRCWLRWWCWLLRWWATSSPAPSSTWWQSRWVNWPAWNSCTLSFGSRTSAPVLPEWFCTAITSNSTWLKLHLYIIDFVIHWQLYARIWPSNRPGFALVGYQSIGSLNENDQRNAVNRWLVKPLRRFNGRIIHHTFDLLDKRKSSAVSFLTPLEIRHPVGDVTALPASGYLRAPQSLEWKIQPLYFRRSSRNDSLKKNNPKPKKKNGRINTSKSQIATNRRIKAVPPFTSPSGRRWSCCFALYWCGHSFPVRKHTRRRTQTIVN